MIKREDYSDMAKYETFTNWFRIHIPTRNIVVIPVVDKNNMTSIPKSTFTVKFMDENGYADDWSKFEKRPEFQFYVWKDSFENQVDMIDRYERLLLATTMIIAEEDDKNPDSILNSVFRCLDWLRTTDFYNCPASTQYHDNFVGGLLLHTLKVANRCMELCDAKLFGNEVSVARAIRACLVHDWCKIGLYESFNRNVKDEVTDSWDAVASYKYKKNRSVCLGHGASSMFIASKFFKLSYEEALAIRWHMGEYNVADSEMPEFSQACRQYPMVYLLQFADRLSCVDY